MNVVKIVSLRPTEFYRGADITGKQDTPIVSKEKRQFSYRHATTVGTAGLLNVMAVAMTAVLMDMNHCGGGCEEDESHLKYPTIL